MSSGVTLFQDWAPPSDPWSPWVKPSLFAQITDVATAATNPIARPETSWARSQSIETVIVVDLPGVESLYTGFALAAEGYRLVPLYNTSHGEPRPALDVKPLIDALSAPFPADVKSAIARGGPPAFLVDWDRNPSSKRLDEGTYDNRWVVFPQDFPSGNLLRSRGITRAVLLQPQADSQPQEDLAHVLLRWQEAGIRIFLHKQGSSANPAETHVRRPSRFRALRYRVLVMMGLRRNSAGGFGGVIPLSSSTSG